MAPVGTPFLVVYVPPEKARPLEEVVCRARVNKGMLPQKLVLIAVLEFLVHANPAAQAYTALVDLRSLHPAPGGLIQTEAQGLLTVHFALLGRNAAFAQKAPPETAPQTLSLRVTAQFVNAASIQT